MKKRNKRKKSLTTKNTQKLNQLNVLPYECYRNEQDLWFDGMSDRISTDIKYHWKTFGVTRLNNTSTNSGEKFPHSIKYQTEMFEKYGTKNKFYHLTSPLNSIKILSEGLKGCGVKKNTSMGNSGEIYLIESDSEVIWNYVGYSQLGCGVNGLPMVVLEIDSEGINGEMFSENCNDYPSPLHTMVEQNLIEPKWIKKVFEFKTSLRKFYEDRMDLHHLKLEYLLNHYPNSTNNTYKMVG